MLPDLLRHLSSLSLSARSSAPAGIAADVGRPVLVAVDGRSGVGKSTLAAQAAARLPSCVVIDGDDFYAGGDAEQWDAMTPAQRAAFCIDWRRQRPVLEALADRRPASWHGYDWEAYDGRRRVEATVVAPADVVILEGAYSARPELADLLDLRVLLVMDDAARRRRLRRRDGDDYHEDWSARWTTAEDHYFGAVVAPTDFDLVLDADAPGAPGSPGAPGAGP